MTDQVSPNLSRVFASALQAYGRACHEFLSSTKGLAAYVLSLRYWARWDEIEWDWPEPEPFADHERILTVAGGKLFRVTRCGSDT